MNTPEAAESLPSRPPERPLLAVIEGCNCASEDEVGRRSSRCGKNSPRQITSPIARSWRFEIECMLTKENGTRKIMDGCVKKCSHFQSSCPDLLTWGQFVATHLGGESGSERCSDQKFSPSAHHKRGSSAQPSIISLEEERDTSREA